MVRTEAAEGAVLRIFRKAPDREPRVRQLFDAFISEGEILDAVGSFAPYSAPASVAICETAFAHVAMLQHVCTSRLRAAEAARIAGALGGIVEHAFASGDEETDGFYRSLLLEDVPLGRAARLSVLAYHQRAVWPEQVALILCGRIGCAAGKTMLIDATLRDFARRVEDALKEKLAA